MSFCVRSTDHFYFPRFEHLTDGSNPRAFVSAFVQPTGADVYSLDSFMDEPVDFFLNSLVVLWFCLSYAAAAVTGHHRGQNGIFRIVFEKGCTVLEAERQLTLAQTLLEWRQVSVAIFS